MNAPLTPRAPTEPTDTDTLAVLIGMILLAGIGNLGVSFHPFIVGGAVDILGFTEARAGHLAAVEMAGFALGSFTMSLKVHVWNRRYLATAGALLVISANLASCFAITYAPLMALRGAAGVGSAFCLSVFSATAAATSIPDRTFGLVNATSIAGSGIIIGIAGYLVSIWGLPSIYVMIAVLTIIFSIGIARIPARVTVSSVEGDAVIKGPSPSVTQKRIGIPLCLLLMLFMFAGQYAIWAYQERIGVSIGLTASEIGFWIGLGRLTFGTAASILASYVALRFGRVWPQVISLSACVIGVFIIVFGATRVSFAFGSTLLTTGMFYGLAYQQGLLSGFDPMGRANVAGDMMSTLGLALGPVLVGLVMVPGEYSFIGWLSGGLLTCALCLALGPAIILNRLDRQARHTKSHQTVTVVPEST